MTNLLISAGLICCMFAAAAPINRHLQDSPSTFVLPYFEILKAINFTASNSSECSIVQSATSARKF